MNVSGHHIEVTESLRGYVETKIEKIARHFDLVSDVNCILTVEKLRHKAEATVKVNGGKIYADSIPAKSTVFRIILPRIQVSEADLKASREQNLSLF